MWPCVESTGRPTWAWGQLSRVIDFSLSWLRPCTTRRKKHDLPWKKEEINRGSTQHEIYILMYLPRLDALGSCNLLGSRENWTMQQRKIYCKTPCIYLFIFFKNKKLSPVWFDFRAVFSRELRFDWYPFLSRRSLREKIPSRILVSFASSLVCLYTVFLVGIEQTSSHVGCIIVAILIHYFTLSSVVWMGVEASNLYLKLVKVFGSDVRHFMSKASIVAWGECNQN